MTTSTAGLDIPGYLAGTWSIDPVHSEVGFVVRHMMVSKVRGLFRSFTGEIVTSANPLEPAVTASIDLASVDTGNPQRDEHLRSADFFGTETCPTMTYRSSAVRAGGDGFIIDGELTLKGISRHVPLLVEPGGFGPDAWGGTRAGFTARAQISRHDFGVDFNPTLEAGGVVAGDRVTIELEIQAVRNG